MRIIQITDQHIGGPEEKPWSVDVRNQFLQVCARITQIEPDHLMVTGDLCLEKGDESIYKWIKKELEEMHIPYSVLSGNHDNAVLLASVFGLEEHLHDGELYFTRSLGTKEAICLDTSSGTMSDRQLRWLQAQLVRINDPHPLVFMHHPPVLTGVPHMDRMYPMEAGCRDVLARIFEAYQGQVDVFCGHYHSARTVRTAFGTVYIAPSSYVQINPFREAFEPEHTYPGFRIIDLLDSQLRTAVHYILPTHE